MESYDLGAKKDLREEFSDLESAEAVERELRELKGRRAAKQGAKSG